MTRTYSCLLCSFSWYFTVWLSWWVLKCNFGKTGPNFVLIKAPRDMRPSYGMRPWDMRLFLTHEVSPWVMRPNAVTWDNPLVLRLFRSLQAMLHWVAIKLLSHELWDHFWVTTPPLSNEITLESWGYPSAHEANIWNMRPSLNHDATSETWDHFKSWGHL
jgi:hypothetical protein